MKVTKSHLIHKAGALGIAGIIEYGMQLLVPVFLVRYLSPADFGNYRMLWLLAFSLVAIVPCNMPQSLFYYLPRCKGEERGLRIGNTLLFLSVGGALSALFYSQWNFVFPLSLQALNQYSVLVPVFLFTWVVSSLLDVLPTADGKAHWQAWVIIAVALIRAAALLAAGILSKDIELVIAAMCFLALVKCALIVYYLWDDRSSTGLNLPLMKSQLLYSIPFAIGNGLFLLRAQADQWIVLYFFQPEEFALFSIAAVALPFSTLLRKPVNNAVLPKVNDLLGKKDIKAARILITKSYMMMSISFLPPLGLLYACSTELIDLVYTSAYIDSAPIMKIYIIGQMTGVFAAGHLLAAVNQGRLTALISPVLFVFSLTMSLVGIALFGLIGAALGSVSGLIAGEIWALTVVARCLDSSPLRLVNWKVACQVLIIVIIAIAISQLTTKYLFGISNLILTLFTEAFTYLLLVVAGIWITGLHRNVIELIQGKFSHE